jgi:predicted ester cyclase
MREAIIAANDTTYAAWNAHDPDAVTGPLRGRDAIHGRAADLFAAFPDFRLERLFLVVDGPANADRWRGTHEAAFMGLESTGRRIGGG